VIKIKIRCNPRHHIPNILPAVLVLLTPYFVLLSVREADCKISDTLRYRGGLRNSSADRRLNSNQLEIVLKSLREKTGFLEMKFDEDGFLNIGDRTKFDGGSATARSLISAATECGKAIELESHNYSSEVAFARLALPVIFHNRSSGKSIDVYSVELDFNDFKKLRGDNQVLSAFDIGFVIMHELGHAVLNLNDNLVSINDVGECEGYINRIRGELNLPQRLNYIAQTFKSPLALNRPSGYMAELIFSHSDVSRLKSNVKELYLRWEAHAVGPVRPNVASTILKPGGAKPITASLK
jgi:hypothetical protein